MTSGFDGERCGPAVWEDPTWFDQWVATALGGGPENHPHREGPRPPEIGD